MIEKIIDQLRKPTIFKRSMKSGCDVDGDIITYRNKLYYVHILSGTLKRVKVMKGE